MINSENSAFSRHTRSGNVIDDVCVKTSFYNVFTHNNPKATDKKSLQRKGCIDIWNGFMANGALFSVNDIPCCPTTSSQIPTSLITWEEASSIHREEIKRRHRNYKVNSFICFYIDDYKFDNSNGIWNKPTHALKIIKHFAGIITPDFSTFQDFPDPIKRISTYKMRLFGYWAGTQGVQVINNVRWGTDETFDYCFDGLPTNGILAIGTVGGSPYRIEDRCRFEIGLKKLIELLNPHTLIFYGSSNYTCIKELKALGIEIVTFPSKTAQFYEEGKKL